MFVKRNASGEIVALSLEAGQGCDEAIAAHSSELQAFLLQCEPDFRATVVQATLQSSDLQMSRVVEDLINLLIDKNLIQFTELPLPAQHKLMQRQEMREHFQAIKLLDDDHLAI